MSKFARGSYPVRAILFVILTAVVPLCDNTVVAQTSNTKTTPTITSGCEYDYPPFCIVDKNNKLADGFSVELMREALKVMDRDVAFEVGPWAQVKEYLEQGEIDVLPLVARTPERESIFDFTFPYLSLHGVIVVAQGTDDINDLDDLKGRNIAVMEGDISQEFLEKIKLDASIQTTSTFEDALRELSDGKHDAVVIQRLLALRLMQSTGIRNLKIVGKPLDGLRIDFCFAVKEGDKKKLALLNEGLAIVMADGTFSRLQTKWFAPLELPLDNNIVIGGNHNYPPYEYLDENGRPAGYNVELTKAIARNTGLNIKIQLGPWAQIKQGLDSGEIDAVHGMFYSPQRDLKYDFSPLHAVVHQVAIMRKAEGTPPANADDLKDKRIVVMQGDIMHDWAIKKNLDTQLTAVETQEDALKELAQGKHDYALVARLPAMHWIKKHRWENLIVGDKPLRATEYCYAVPQGQKALLAKLNEGLKILHDSGEYQDIYAKWMGVYEKTPSVLDAIVRIVDILLAPLLLLFFVSIIWSRKMRKKINRLTNQLQDTERKLKHFNSASAVTVAASERNAISVGMLAEGESVVKAMNPQKRFLLLTIIMVGVSAAIILVMTAILYQHQFEEHRQQLQATAQSYARLIEAVARYDKSMAGNIRDKNPDYKPSAATLSQVVDAHEQYEGFGETGEITLARREGDSIVFVMGHRYGFLEHPAPVPFDSNIAEPMRLALKQLSGTIIGLDYRGETVLAAYEPVSELNIGIVVKIDLAEIRAPFIKSGISAAAVALLVVLAGAAMFIRIGNPMIERLEQYTRGLEKEVEDRKWAEQKIKQQQYYLEKAQELGQIGTWELDITGNKLYWTEENCHIFGVPTGSVMNYEIFIDKVHPDDRGYVNEQWAASMQGKPYDIEHRIVIDGTTKWVREKADVEFNDEGKAISAIGFTQDITNRKYWEQALSKLVKATSSHYGSEFFNSVALELAEILNADYTLIGELSKNTYGLINTIAVVADGKLIDNFEYDLAGTPCENVVGDCICTYSSGVAEKFPQDLMLGEMNVEGYVGVPLFDSKGKVLGVMAAMFRNPIKNHGQPEAILQVFSNQAGSEMQRTIYEQALRDSEQLLRRIAEDYPNSYVSLIEADYTIGFTAGREFIENNLAPESFVGLTPDQVFGDKASFVERYYKKTFQGEDCVFELFINDQHRLYKTVAMRSEDGSIPRILVVVENITERKHVETEREQLIAELKDNNKETQKLIYTISHDMKKPLITIGDHLETAKKDLAQGKVQQTGQGIEQIENAVEKMKKILEDLV